jgi:ATP-binding cassette subfamily C protein CydC
VSFGYDPDRLVLDHVNFTVQPGERVAIGGPSGAGKSTIALLALRLADPLSGRVRFGGTDLREVAGDDLHRHAALMPQDAPVFLDTIRGNLLIGDPQAADETLWQALRAARLDAFVASLPAGLDTLIGEAGATLSTGQRRRLVLARTLLCGAGMLVLDEPTSGLDRDAELAFFNDLAAVSAGRTVIVITHAGLPAGAVDRLLTLRAGRLGVA